MGEIAEMMLDGTLCAGCGDVLGDIIADMEPDHRLAFMAELIKRTRVRVDEVELSTPVGHA
jgi:hypothetical protein